MFSKTSFTYTVKARKATISIDNGGQTSNWNGQPASLDLNKFKPVITDTTEGNTNLSLPSSVTLTKDDYNITPTNSTGVGEYTVSLTENGIQKIENAIDPASNRYKGQSNYNWTVGTSKLTINAVDANYKFSGSTTVHSIGTPSLDTLTKAITSTNTISGQPLNFSQLTLSDFDWYDSSTATTPMTSAPTKDGTYYLKLNSNGITAIKNANPGYNLTLGDNLYTYTIATTGTQTINYVDKEGNQKGSQVISGKTDQTVKVTPQVPAGWEVIGTTPVPKTVKIPATDTPITITIGHKIVAVTPDSPKTPSDSLPDNPGKKYPSGVSATDLNKTVTRTINVTDPTTGKITTSHQTVTFTRTATVDEVNGNVTSYGNWSENGKHQFGEVTVPGYEAKVTGSTAPETVTPDSGDQTVTIAYEHKTVEVTPDSPKMPNDSLPDNPGKKYPSGVSATDLNKKVTRTINVTDPTTGKTTTSHQTVTFTRTATVDEVNGNVTYGDWSENGKHQFGEVTVPSYAGYEAKVTGSTAAETVNPDSNDQTVTITYSHKTVEVTPSQPKTTNDPLPDNPSKKYPSGVGQSDLNKTVTRTINVTAAQPNGNTTDETVNITYTANKQATHIIYKDGKGNVIKTDTVNGQTDQTVDTKSTVPAGWKISDGSSVKNVPTTITFKGASTPDTTIIVEHNIIPVKPGDLPKPGDVKPGTTEKEAGDGKPNKNITYADLHKTITRTVTITDPHTGKSDKTQTLNFERTGSIDDVTGDVTYSDWIPAGQSGSFTEVTIPDVDGYTKHVTTGDLSGYTPTQDQINNWTDPDIKATYTADNQTTHIIYKDEKGNVVKTDTVNGQTDQTVDTKSTVPAGWKIAGSSTVKNVPTTITFTGASTPDTTIIVEHNMIPVKPGDLPKPGDTKPGTTNNKSGDGKPNKDITYNDLHKTITRTVTIKDPHNGDQDKTQTLNFERTGAIDDVTGNVTYCDWTPAGQSGSFTEVTIPDVPGYTKSVTNGDLSGYTPSQDQITNWKDPKITATYTANDGTQMINYVDGKGTPEESQVISGKTDQTVPVTPQVPAGWKVIGTTPVPKTVKIPATDTPIAITVGHKTVTVTPDSPKTTDDTLPDNPGQKYPSGVGETDLHKTVTRTINVTDPSGKTTTTTQTAKLTRTATVDEVDGTVKYSGWTVSNNGWNEFDVPEITDYTPSQTSVTATTPTGDTQNQTINITYTQNTHTNTVKYVDENGNVITTDEVSGKIGDKIPVALPDGYHFKDGKTPNLVISSDAVQIVNIVKDQVNPGASTVNNNGESSAIDGEDSNISGSVNSSNIAANNNKQGRLPQTGNTTHRGLSVVGLALASVVGLFDAGFKKKRN